LIAVKQITLAVVNRLDRPAPVFRDACDEAAPLRRTDSVFSAMSWPAQARQKFCMSTPSFSKILHIAAKYFKKSRGTAAMKSRFLPNRAGDRRFLDRFKMRIIGLSNGALGYPEQ
jgi:hypothetical protein